MRPLPVVLIPLRPDRRPSSFIVWDNALSLDDRIKDTERLFLDRVDAHTQVGTAGR
jgi:hypothetical protein